MNGKTRVNSPSVAQSWPIAAPSVQPDHASRGRARTLRAAHVFKATTEVEAALIKLLDEATARAAADRARAAADRARAARERDELQAQLRSAHLDHLTGAYRREMGRLAISNEIERSRRSEKGLVLAFVDVDRLKAVNDRDGHAAGDRVLQTVAQAIRTNLRSFDPIVRHGGDEFVCALAGVELLEAKRRFASINAAIEVESHVAISVGLAELADGDTVDRLTERADMAMLRVKARHHAAVDRRATLGPALVNQREGPFGEDLVPVQVTHDVGSGHMPDVEGERPRARKRPG